MNESSLETPVLPNSKNDESNEERPHHPYSPSTLGNIEYCPCYKGRQSDTPHVRTVAGTRAHGAVETGEDDHRLTDEDAVAAAECLDFVEQRRRLMHEWGIRDQTESEVKLGRSSPNVFFPVCEHQETYLPIDDLTFPDCKSTTAGYTDRILVSYDQTYAEGFDWKFGFWPVEDPQDNLQVIAYSLGVFKMFPRMQRVRFWIKQPHLDVVRDAVFERKDIPHLYLRIQTVVARAREARTANTFSSAKPAVPVCNFCANLGRCEKVCQFACKVGSKFHPLEIPTDITPTMLQDPTQTNLGLRLAAVLKIWCDAFRRQVTDRIIRREAELPPGQKIQTMRKRELVDMVKVRMVALKYLTTAEFEATLETTFGAVETLIQDKAPRGAKKAMVKEFQDELLATGAVKLGDEFSFLRAVSVKDSVV